MWPIAEVTKCPQHGGWHPSPPTTQQFTKSPNDRASRSPDDRAARSPDDREYRYAPKHQVVSRNAGAVGAVGAVSVPTIDSGENREVVNGPSVMQNNAEAPLVNPNDQS